MNKKYLYLLLILGFTIATALPSFAQSSKQTSKLALGLRSHSDSSASDSPLKSVRYSDGDMSYAVAYEYQDGPSYWQVVLDYCNGKFAGDDATVDYMVTPQLNLMATDNFWRGGVGVLTSYKKRSGDATRDSDWTSLYWQLIAGISIPVGRVELDLLAFFPFDSWGDISDFDVDSIEYGGWLKFSF